MVPTPLLLGSEEAREEDVDLLDDFHKVVLGRQRQWCHVHYAPRREIVTLYAKLGLHRYNILQGKDLKLSSIEKFIMSWGSAASSYSITLKALDPETSGSLQTFQSRVNEHKYGKLVLSCYVARPLGENIKTKRSMVNTFRLHRLIPELPPEDPFKGDTDRFYVLKKSEIRRNEWILLYLQLAVATTSRSHIKHGVANLKILKAAMEITPDQEEPFNKGLDAYDAIFYIKYKDSCQARAGNDDYRVAIVRRMLEQQSHVLRLVGCTQTFKPSNSSAPMEACSSSAQD